MSLPRSYNIHSSLQNRIKTSPKHLTGLLLPFQTARTDLYVVPDGQVGVLGGQHGPASEGLHHGDGLLVEGEPDLTGDQGGLVGDIEHGVVNLGSNCMTSLSPPTDSHLEWDSEQTRGDIPELLISLPVEEPHQPAVPALHHLLQLGADLQGDRWNNQAGEDGSKPVLL